MSALSWPSIGFYCIFGIFVFYQQLHGKNFKGESQGFALVLHLFAFAGMITGIAYLIYYGWAVAWWAPIPIFFIGTAASFAGVILERIVGGFAISMAGFLVWPASAFMMFKLIPVLP